MQEEEIIESFWKVYSIFANNRTMTFLELGALNYPLESNQYGIATVNAHGGMENRFSV